MEAIGFKTKIATEDKLLDSEGKERGSKTNSYRKQGQPPPTKFSTKEPDVTTITDNDKNNENYNKNSKFINDLLYIGY